jgi:hypothetical protein
MLASARNHHVLQYSKSSGNEKRLKTTNKLQCILTHIEQYIHNTRPGLAVKRNEPDFYHRRLSEEQKNNQNRQCNLKEPGTGFMQNSKEPGMTSTPRLVQGTSCSNWHQVQL